MKVGRSTEKNGPLDRFWTVFQQTIGDPAQFFLSQLADLEVVSLLLHKTNRAEQRQLDSPPPRQATVDRTLELFAKGHHHVHRFLFLFFIFAMFYAETEVKMKPACQRHRAKKTLRGTGGRETKDGSHRHRKARATFPC